MASQARTFRQPDFFLIVAEDDGRISTVGDDATFAIFGGEGEAKTFLSLEEYRYGKVLRTSPGELISMLDVSCTDMKRVALDPSPEMVAGGLVGLVSMDKDIFLERFTKRHRGSKLPAAPPCVREARAAL